jgi:hypothetical protein
MISPVWGAYREASSTPPDPSAPPPPSVRLDPVTDPRGRDMTGWTNLMSMSAPCGTFTQPNPDQLFCFYTSLAPLAPIDGPSLPELSFRDTGECAVYN